MPLLPASGSTRRYVSVSWVQIVVLTIGGVVALLAAVAMLNDSSSFFAESRYSHRFHTDNAVGATANAVEHIATRQGRKARLQ